VSIDCACVLVYGPGKELVNHSQTRRKQGYSTSVCSPSPVRSTCATLRHSNQSWTEYNSHGVLNRKARWWYAPRILGRRRKLLGHQRELMNSLVSGIGLVRDRVRQCLLRPVMRDYADSIGAVTGIKSTRGEVQGSQVFNGLESNNLKASLHR
jgi:hypothetical protein